MPKHPPVPHLFLVNVDGRDVVALRAMSSAEARDAFLEGLVRIEKLTPARAFRVGQTGLVDIHDAKPEYAALEVAAQGDLLPEFDGIATDHIPTPDAPGSEPATTADTNEA